MDDKTGSRQMVIRSMNLLTFWVPEGSGRQIAGQVWYDPEIPRRPASA
jgi:hypothetical protein